MVRGGWLGSFNYTFEILGTFFAILYEWFVILQIKETKSNFCLYQEPLLSKYQLKDEKQMSFCHCLTIQLSWCFFFLWPIRYICLGSWIRYGSLHFFLQFGCHFDGYDNFFSFTWRRLLLYTDIHLQWLRLGQFYALFLFWVDSKIFLYKTINRSS